jgi:uncharacterized membrane protein YoaK (UPF0700 family)
LPVSTTEKGGLAVLLASVGGFVDAVGYLTLFNLYVGQMSGNSVSFGVNVGQGRASDALIRIVPIVLFVLALAVGVAAIEVLRRIGRRRTTAVLLTVEVALLAVYLTVGTVLRDHGLDRGSPGFFLLLCFAVAAMAMQTAALQRVGGQTVHTTYVTGMLTHLAEESVRYLFLRGDRRRGVGGTSGIEVLASPEPPGAEERSSRARVVLLGALWLGYASGACLGGWLEPHWHLRALGLPMAALGAVIAADLIRPLGEAQPTRA